MLLFSWFSLLSNPEVAQGLSREPFDRFDSHRSNFEFRVRAVR